MIQTMTELLQIWPAYYDRPATVATNASSQRLEQEQQ